MNPVHSQRLGQTEENANFKFLESQFIHPQNGANNWECLSLHPLKCYCQKVKKYTKWRLCQITYISYFAKKM